MSEISEAGIREQLDRILVSKTFQRVPRLKRFLTFIVEETVQGRGGALKEFVVGTEVFDKVANFDPRSDPIVRVQAGRLRATLARYYLEEGRNDDVLIDLPKGHYAAVFRRRESLAPRRLLSSILYRRNSIAILPFSDDTPGREMGYFCQGLRQEIIHTLVPLETIRVVVTQRSCRSDAAGTEEGLSAAMIVSGSVRKSGKCLRITSQLIDGASGMCLWSQSVDSSERDVFAVQEEVARSIFKQLQKAMSAGGKSNWLKRRTENPAAYNLYLQGRYHLNQRTEKEFRKAVDFFERAIQEDAHFAEAYSGLADAYKLLGHYGGLGPAEVWSKAASNAAWAVLQNENSAEAHTSLAHILSTQDWNWPGAEQEFKQALQLDPWYPTAHHWYAISLLAPLGNLDDALDEMLLAQALDPISPIIARDVAVVCYYKRDFEGALEQCERTIDLNPQFAHSFRTVGLIQEQMGNLDESVAAFRHAVELSPDSPKMRAGLARSLALRGRKAEAVRTLKDLQEFSKTRYVPAFELASIHFAIGDNELGFEWLRKALQSRCFELISMKVDPMFDPIRNDPRFAPVQQQLGF
jgi:TolB-like protein/Flp pilus assembly protein TadD